MTVLGDLKVSISVKGFEVPEFQNHSKPDTNPIRSTRYIEAESGMKFVFHIRVPPTYRFTSDGIKLAIFIDGRYLEHCAVNNEDWEFEPGSDWKHIIRGIERERSGRWRE